MSEIKNFFATTLTVLGTVIGAGFISGREIVTFFYGYDLFYSSIIFAAGFTVVLFILFFDRSYTRSKWFLFFKPIIYIGDLILAAGMLSALDGLYSDIFEIEGFPVLSVAALIISNVIVSDGLGGIKTSNLFLTPVIIAIALIMIATGNNSYHAIGKSVNLVAVFEYIGLNVFTSSILFSKMGGSAKPVTLVFSAIVSSLILAAMIYFISSSIFDKDVVFDEMPLLTRSKDIPFIKHAFIIALLFGIFTTLLSSHYPLYDLVKTEKFNIFVQLLLSLLIFSISRIGFYNIVSKLYPIMGGVGFLYIVVTSILQAFFRSLRPKNT